MLNREILFITLSRWGETVAFLSNTHVVSDMAYPKPVPAFTPDAFRETMNRVEETTVPDEEKAAVDELRAEIRSESED
ncbi:hypothetical protein SAMN05421752_12122 [Natronorubrum thiooxidans]|uniref:Uncharacterized protein n=1 Tax=Natronorubrum thiooxidans TaxID=308853 RepID=A0A1N7H225_9EURY|nr:hypothetical protein SAMN05421752_12122 [Natronorubrum thiooxidans]